MIHDLTTQKGRNKYVEAMSKTNKLTIMTLQETVSKILNRKVSIEEAKDFANDQYGLLCAYNRGVDIEADITLYPERAEKYAKMQHFLGEQGKKFVKFNEWKNKKN